MKHILSVLIALCLAGGGALHAQQAEKAKSILDQAAANYKKSQGISIQFEGTQPGTLLLQGDCFYLNCGGVESWFDGKTQWSYMQQNNEVTISSPTPEELEAINPYAIINSYNTRFRYGYKGEENINGNKTYHLALAPKQKGDIKVISLWLSKNYSPVRIIIKDHDGNAQTFNIRSYTTQSKQPESAFRFDTKKHPKAEVVDMR